MKRLILLISDTFIYYRKSFYVAAFVYVISIVFGMLFFQNEIIPINPNKIAFHDLLKHNLFTMFLIISAGTFTFGLLGNFIIVANGVVLGRILIGVYNSSGHYPIFRYVAPHFIFETVALCIAAAISYETYKFFYNMRHVESKVISIKYVLISLFFMLLFILIAACIESKV
ncbi:MAG: stage II sporulation protein M [Breznakia sp.]